MSERIFNPFVHQAVRRGELERLDRRITVKVVVCDQELFDRGPFDFGKTYEDGTLSAVIDSLLAIREAIPAEYRATARCEIDSVDSWEGSHKPHIEVTYERPETDEEWAQRRADVAQRLEQDRAIARQEYERLKRQFGDQ